MTTRDGFDRQIATWLDESAGTGGVDYLDETLSAISGHHQRPAWIFPARWLPVTSMLAGTPPSGQSRSSWS
jgi:hypothetical protein